MKSKLKFLAEFLGFIAVVIGLFIFAFIFAASVGGITI